jgi:hypothetical protein
MAQTLTWIKVSEAEACGTAASRSIIPQGARAATIRTFSAPTPPAGAQRVRWPGPSICGIPAYSPSQIQKPRPSTDTTISERPSATLAGPVPGSGSPLATLLTRWFTLRQ